MEEIEKAHKNAELINVIKEYSQLKAFGSIKDNDEMAEDIKQELSEWLYYRNNLKDDNMVEYFYKEWITKTYYYNAEALKE